MAIIKANKQKHITYLNSYNNNRSQVIHFQFGLIQILNSSFVH